MLLPPLSVVHQFICPYELYQPFVPCPPRQSHWPSSTARCTSPRRTRRSCNLRMRNRNWRSTCRRCRPCSKPDDRNARPERPVVAEVHAGHRVRTRHSRAVAQAAVVRRSARQAVVRAVAARARRAIRDADPVVDVDSMYSQLSPVGHDVVASHVKSPDWSQAGGPRRGKRPCQRRPSRREYPRFRIRRIRRIHRIHRARCPRGRRRLHRPSTRR